MVTNDNDHLKTDQSLCPLKALTGMPCPSCGITKSMVYFYEGNLLKSIEYHILGPAVITFSFFVIVLFVVELRTKKDYFQKYLYHRKLAYGLAIFLAVYHLIRLVVFIRSHSFDEIVKESMWR
jgi:Protein of unknown function (DUF2752)